MKLKEKKNTHFNLRIWHEPFAVNHAHDVRELHHKQTEESNVSFWFSFFLYLLSFNFENVYKECDEENKKIENNFTVIFYKQKAQNAIAYARTH